MQNFEDVQCAAKALEKALGFGGGAFASPEIGIVLGTGLGETLDMELLGHAAFADLPGFPSASVNSHKGRFLLGKIAGRAVIAQQGRCHLYEGFSPAQVCMGVRVMASLGIRAIIITNAAGALNPLFEAGTLMCMADIINHTGLSPLTGPNFEAFGDRFPDMSAPFDADMQKLALECAGRQDIRLERGVYIGVHGPEMETPAETRMYRQWGADAIGMSACLEVIAARHMGLRVLGISAIANKNLPDCMQPAPIEEVVAMAGKAAKNLGRVIHGVCGHFNG